MDFFQYQKTKETKAQAFVSFIVADDGKTEKIKTSYENGELVFTLKHFSDYVVTMDEPEISVPATGDTMMLGTMTMMVLSIAMLAVLLKLMKRRAA